MHVAQPTASRQSQAIQTQRCLTGQLDIKANLKGAARSAAVSLALSDIDGTLQSLKMGGLVLDLDAKLDDKVVKGNLKTPLARDMETNTLVLPASSGS